MGQRETADPFVFWAMIDEASISVSSEGRGMQRIGFIGLGAMGGPMAERIQQQRPASAPLVLHARRKESAATALRAGAVWAETPADLASRVDVVVTMLPDLPELREVIYASGGLLSGAQAPLVVVACSTSSPEETRAFGADVAKDSDSLLELVDAPVSGGIEGAAAGRLSIFLGGSPQAAQAAAAALAPCGTCAHLGPLGSGQVAKAANQLIVAATTAALGEAVVMAERAGLDLAALIPILAGGYAGSRLLEVKGQKFIDHDHSPASPARFMIKDLRFALAEASATGTPAPILQAAETVFRHMVEAGMGDLDSAGVQAYLDSVRPAHGSGTTWT